MADSDELDLDRFLPYRLSVLAGAVSRQLASLYGDRFGLSVYEWRVMAILASHPGSSADEVAERTAMDKVAVSRAVRRLCERGMASRRVSAADRRRSVLRLSATGRRCYRRIVPLVRGYEARLVEGLGKAERATLDAVLRRLQRIVDESAVTR